MERKIKVYMACSHVRHMSYRISQLRYQFTGRVMPLQKLSGVSILVSLQGNVDFPEYNLHRVTNSAK